MNKKLLSVATLASLALAATSAFAFSSPTKSSFSCGCNKQQVATDGVKKDQKVGEEKKTEKTENGESKLQ